MIIEANNTYIKYLIITIWISNCILSGAIAIQQSWLPNMNAGSAQYSQIVSDPFDGTIMPILYIPDWSKEQYQNKTIKFSDISISDFIPLPTYDPIWLVNISNTSKKSLITHYTYITPYMGSYRLNYLEYDGSHNAIDIRAPIGTPVLSIANGVVVRTIESDPTGNKLVVIRHDGININGKKQSIYSCYLHLSEIDIQEGKKIKKWEMLGRVGMTWIATTPHLHIQIDTDDAPFHPYWPFSTADSKASWLSFFDSINAWLGKENAMKYSIHPMNFISMYMNGNSQSQESPIINSIADLQSAPQIPKEQSELVPVNASIESIVQRMWISWSTPTSLSKVSTTVTTPAKNIYLNNKQCEKNKLPEISNLSKWGKTFYQSIEGSCIFQSNWKFNPNATITQKDAIMMIMKYYKITPANGTSHFLDIDIGDNFQGYAIAGYRRGIIDGNYAAPSKLLSKWDFIELLVKIGKIERNPSQIKIYKDTSAMNIKFNYIQDYAFKIHARWGNFNSDSLLTVQWAIEIMGNILTNDQIKK